MQLKLMRIKGKGYLVSILALSLLVSCGEHEGNATLNETDESGQDSLSPEQQDRLENAQNVFYSIPSPIEMASILKKTGAKYDYTLLNDVEHIDKYMSANDQALNLGVYGADLSYTSIFNETNESMLYMKATQTLAEELNISSAIDDQLAQRLEANVEIKDSLISLISEVYWNLDNYLKESERDNMSALIIYGGWLEGLYLTTSLLDTDSTSVEVRQEVAEQKLALNNLVSLVKQYGEDEALSETLADLEALAELYKDVQIEHERDDITTDAESGVTVIGGSNKIQITDEQLMAIKAKAEEIRSRIVK